MSPLLGQAMLSSHDAVARNEIRLNKAGLTPLSRSAPLDAESDALRAHLPALRRSSQSR